MKNILIATLTLFCACAFNTQTNAQTAGSDEAAVLKMWNDVWQAYEKNDEAKMWSFYAENACEIYPDGSSLSGLGAIKAGYAQFKDMMEGTPTWTSTTPTVTFIEPNVALLVSDVTSDIKLKGGQQIGGQSKFAAVVHKVKGQWLIAFDSQTPAMQMSDSGK